MMDFWIDNKRGSWMLLCMARKLRLEYPGAIYHVMNRGDYREPMMERLQ